MALAKFLEDIVERYYEDLAGEVDAPARSVAEMEARLGVYKRATEQLKNQVEELLDVVTDPGFNAATEFGRQRTVLTALERTVEAQQREIEVLRRRQELHSSEVAELESERNRLRDAVPGRLRSVVALGELRQSILRQYEHPLDADAHRRVIALLSPIGLVAVAPQLYLSALAHPS